jgi:hypothetical protein
MKLTTHLQVVLLFLLSHHSVYVLQLKFKFYILHHSSNFLLPEHLFSAFLSEPGF